MPLWASSCRLCVERNSFGRDRIPGSDARAFLSITPKSGPGQTIWTLNVLRRIVKGEVRFRRSRWDRSTQRQTSG